MTEAERMMVERLYDAFNHRDEKAIAALCDEEVELVTFPPGEVEPGPVALGPRGLLLHLEDLAASWEEMLVLPKQVEVRREMLLVRGHVYLRGRERGIRDIPVAWVWRLRHGRFWRGEAFADTERAAERFAAACA